LRGDYYPIGEKEKRKRDLISNPWGEKEEKREGKEKKIDYQTKRRSLSKEEPSRRKEVSPILREKGERGGPKFPSRKGKKKTLSCPKGGETDPMESAAGKEKRTRPILSLQWR